MESDLVSLFEETSTQMLGIVSATVEVASPDALAAVQGDPDVYLVDLAVEQAYRADHGRADVVMNDLYWQLAGWAE